MFSPLKIYQKRIRRYQRLISRLTRSINIIVFLKIPLLMTGLAAIICLFTGKNRPVSGGTFFLCLFLFIILDIRQSSMIRNKKSAAIMVQLNEKSLKRFNNEWTGFPDTGEEFKDDNHPYSSDLDIFGKGSLFQYINSTSTLPGRRKLSGFLTQKPESVASIQQRQEAIGELACKIGWRQRFQTEGILVAAKIQDPEPLRQWGSKYNPFFCLRPVKAVMRILPVFTIASIIGVNISPVVPGCIPWAALFIQLILLLPGRKARNSTLNMVYNYRNSIKLFERLLRHFETHSFQSGILKQLQNNLRNQKGKAAFQQIARLDRIADMIANRYNGFYALINLVTLLDYQCLIFLESWKKESGRHFQKWLDALAEVEALASLSILRFDHPDWVYPVFCTGTVQYTANGLGHPLLPETRVTNDLYIQPPVNVLLITGSNMSGKSTYLRTAGINLALAYAGTPVCAKRFICSLMSIYSCMRISDNLEKNISTFYAELLRIKEIVAEVKNAGPVFFLLDEIFKGTNSLDRHTGAMILIKKLASQGALGIVSTHDLELGCLEAETGGRVKNYHFREFYQENRICFDYKLRPGLSNTRNAMYLIKAAGIEMED